MGFANFYRQFIKNFSAVVSPLTRLTGKGTELVWGLEQQSAFEQLKQDFVSKPSLTHFDPSLETLVEADASGMSTGAVLLQKHADRTWRTVAFHSAKNLPAETNYAIHNKELLAVIKSLLKWEAELKAVEKFTVYMDHKNLLYFTTAWLYTERHVQRNNILSRFNLTFVY